MTRTYYLSFADDDGFRGACYVDVSDDDAQIAVKVLRKWWPNAAPDAEWVTAASQVARRLGCNPGGEMFAVEIPTEKIPKHVERGRLYSKAELENQ